jgi:broad specificity phosphatase PhoE
VEVNRLADFRERNFGEMEGLLAPDVNKRRKEGYAFKGM